MLPFFASELGLFFVIVYLLSSGVFFVRELADQINRPGIAGGRYGLFFATLPASYISPNLLRPLLPTSFISNTLFIIKSSIPFFINLLLFYSLFWLLDSWLIALAVNFSLLALILLWVVRAFITLIGLFILALTFGFIR